MWQVSTEYVGGKLIATCNGSAKEAYLRLVRDDPAWRPHVRFKKLSDPDLIAKRVVEILDGRADGLTIIFKPGRGWKPFSFFS